MTRDGPTENKRVMFSAYIKNKYSSKHNSSVALLTPFFAKFFQTWGAFLLSQMKPNQKYLIKKEFADTQKSTWLTNLVRSTDHLIGNSIF